MNDHQNLLCLHTYATQKRTVNKVILNYSSQINVIQPLPVT